MYCNASVKEFTCSCVCVCVCVCVFAHVGDQGAGVSVPGEDSGSGFGTGMGVVSFQYINSCACYIMLLATVYMYTCIHCSQVLPFPPSI